MEDYSEKKTVKEIKHISNAIAETVNSHFSHYKCMGTISCHSNQRSNPTGIKYNYVQANVINMYEKNQFYPPYGFREEDF